MQRNTLLKRIILGLMLVIVLIIAISVVSSLTKSLSPDRRVANSFLTYSLQGDVNNSYDLFTRDAQARQTRSDWSDRVQQFSSFFQGVKPIYVSQSGKGDVTTQKYTLKGFDGIYDITINEKKTDLGWRVDYFLSQKAS